jgi:hypothetical protein
MPMYFFTVHNIPPSDPIPEELPNDEEAWQKATVFAGEIFKDVDGRLRPDSEWSLEVADESRNPLFMIHIYEEKRVRPPK